MEYLIAAVMILFLLCMAFAHRDESCYPKKHCGTCVRFNKEKPIPPQCCECVKHHPDEYPHWRAIEK